VKQEELSRTLFPLGNLTKPEVRKIAREANLTTADVAESQEICFVPNDNYRTFIENESAAENGLNGSGKFVTPEGKTVAEHRGISHYTVGQRRGLGISGAEPVYVQVIEPDSGDITLAPRRSMFFSGCSLNDLNWHIDETDLDIVNELIVLIRYNHEGVSCKIEWNTDGTAEVKFDEAQFAVAAGQSAVFYDGDRLLGGGIITEGFLNEETTIG
jgi:tRNA-specific 2-thiouridylase